MKSPSIKKNVMSPWILSGLRPSRMTVAIGAIALLLAACSGDSGSKSATTAGDDGREVATLVDMGRCTSEREGDSVYVAEKLKDFLCHNNTWIDLSDVSSDLSSGKTEAETKSSSSNVVEPLSSLAEDGDLTDLSSSDSALSEMETAIGVCETKNVGVVSEYNSVYYICKDNAWGEASVFEYDTYGQTCLADGSIIAGEVVASNKYVCDADTFRIATDDEISLKLGCTSYTDGEIKTISSAVADTIYECTTNKWTKKIQSLFPSIYDETAQTLTDTRDNQIYKTVTIGSLTWMAENLNFDYKVDGVTYGTFTNPENGNVYGRYYTWAAAMDSAGIYSPNSVGCGFGNECRFKKFPVRGICPEGWHIPSSEGPSGSAYSLQAKDYENWPSATNESGFSAIPAGYYYPPWNSYEDVGGIARFWTATQYPDMGAGYGKIYACDMGINSYYRIDNYASKTYGLSIRCVKD